MIIFKAPLQIGGEKGCEGTLASLEAQGFTGEGEASLEQGRRRCDGAVNHRINEGVDSKQASSELAIRNAANHRKAGNCKFLGGCNKAIFPVSFVIITSPSRLRKVIIARVVGGC